MTPASTEPEHRLGKMLLGLLARLAAATPVLPDAEQLVFVDIDDTVRQTYGNAEQGSGRGYTGVKGLNAPRPGWSARRSPCPETRSSEEMGSRTTHRGGSSGAAAVSL
jgi:hypothetical protein